MTSVEKRRSGRKSGGHRKHSDGGYSDTSSAGSYLDETDREVSNLTDRAFRSLCIGDEAVYNDSDLGAASPCTQRDRQLAFSQSAQDRDREREELKRAAHESFSHRMQQYGPDWLHGGMYGAEIQRDPQWEGYGERTQGRVSATFQHSFMETSQEEESLRGEQLSFLSNGATEVSSQQRRSRSRVSSLIRAFNSEGHRDGAVTDGKPREWNDDTSWDKSALMSIQRELSEFSTSYQDNFNSGHFPSTGPLSSRETNFYSSEVAAMTHLNSGSSFMRSSHSQHSMTAQVNSNSNFFIHSEFSPFKVWRDHNRFPFQQGQVSGFMHYPDFPRWYETPMYKELSLEAQPQGPYRFGEERGFRYPMNNMAPVVPPTLPRSTSTSTMLQRAPALEKRCDSELPSHYTYRKRTQSLGTNRLPSQRPSTASPTVEMSRRVQDTISSVKALQQKIKMMTEQNISTDRSANQQGAPYSNDNHIPFGYYAKTEAPNVVSSNTSTTPFNISQLLTPVVHAQQETETLDARQYTVSPQPVEHPPVRAESRGATPDMRMSSYKSRATSLLFNLKDNRKRVKSTYSPTKFKGMETQERIKQPSIQEPRDTVIDIPDFPDTDVQCTQGEESSWTTAAQHHYVNQYHNPGSSFATTNYEPATAYTGQYSEYASDYQTAQMQGQTAHHSGFTGFRHENYTSNQLTNGQTLHEDLASYIPYEQGMLGNVETLGGDRYGYKPSYTATETPRLYADNNQTRELFTKKPNTEQHFHETVGREFPKVDRYQQLKDNSYGYSNVSSQDRWGQTNSQDTNLQSLNAAVYPWKQEINALMETDQHQQDYQRAAMTKEEAHLPRDKYSRENTQGIHKELEDNKLGERYGVETSYSMDGSFNSNISNQLPQYGASSRNSEENPAYYREQQHEAFKENQGHENQSRHNKGNVMKEDDKSQTFNKYTHQEYRNQHTLSLDKDKAILTQETAQRKQLTPTPNGYETQSLQPEELKPQFEYNMQKNYNPDNVSDPKMENQAKDRKSDGVKAGQDTAVHVKAQHAQEELAMAQNLAKEQQPKVEQAKLNLAEQTGSVKVKAEKVLAGLSENKRVNQDRAEHVEEKRKDDLIEQSAEKLPELAKAEQTIVQKVTEEQRNITEEAGAKHMKDKQDEQVTVTQAESERFKEEHIKTEQARIQQSKADKAKRERIKAEQLEEEKLRAEQLEREQAEAEQIRKEKVKAEQAEAQRRKAKQAELKQTQEQVKVEQAKAKVGETDPIQATHVISDTTSQIRKARVEERAEEEAHLKQTKVNTAKSETTKIERVQEGSAKPIIKPTLPQQVKSEPDKVEQVKSELAKAKAELAKIKEKMKGEQKHKVRNAVLTKDDETKKDVPEMLNTDQNVDYNVQDQAPKMHQQSLDLGATGRQSADTAKRGLYEYNLLREKYGFTDTPLLRHKLPDTGNVSLRDADETPDLSPYELETTKDEESKDKHSLTSKSVTAKAENDDEAGSFKPNEVTESQYVYSESSKEFKLSSSSNTPINVDNTPIDVDIPPINYDTPIDVDITPRNVDNTPIKVDTTPFNLDKIPLKVDNTPINGDTIPIIVDKTPIKADNTPINVDKIPLKVENTPIIGDNKTNNDLVTDKVKEDRVEKLDTHDPLIHPNVSLPRDPNLVTVLPLERKLKSTEHSVVPCKDPHSNPSKTLSHKERAQTKQEILTSKIKAHAEKEISAIKEKGFALRDGLMPKTSSKHFGGGQSVSVRQRPPSQEVPKKHDSTMSSNKKPKHQMEPQGIQMAPVKSVSPFSSAAIPVKSTATSSQSVDDSQKVPKEPKDETLPKQPRGAKPMEIHPVRTDDPLVKNQNKDNESSMQSKDQPPKNKQGKQESNHGNNNSGNKMTGLKDDPSVDTFSVSQEKEATPQVEVKRSQPITKEQTESKCEAVLEDSAPSIHLVLGGNKTPVADESLQIRGIMVTVRERKPSLSYDQMSDSTQDQMKAIAPEINSELNKYPSSDLESSKGNKVSKEVRKAETKGEVEQGTHPEVMYDKTTEDMCVHQENSKETKQNNMSENVKGKRTGEFLYSYNTDTRPQREIQPQEPLAEKSSPSTVTVYAKNKTLAETQPLLHTSTNKTLTDKSTKSIKMDEVKSDTQEKNPQKRQTAHPDSNVVSKQIGHIDDSNRTEAERLIKQDIQPPGKEETKTVRSQTKSRDTDGNSAPLLEDKKHNVAPPKPLNKTGPSYNFTENDNRLVENTQVDDNVHIDSIAIRVVQVINEDDLRKAEKHHVTAVPSGVTVSHDHRQVASSIVEEKVSKTLKKEDRTKDPNAASSQKQLTTSLEDNSVVQSVLSGVRKLSDSLKNSGQQESMNATSQSITAENGKPEGDNIGSNSVAESKTQLSEEDYFQVQGMAGSDHELGSNRSVGDLSDAVPERRELPGLPSNKGVLNKESNAERKDEGSVLDQSKTEVSRSASLQENMKRNNRETGDNLASKQSHGPTERHSTKNEKSEADQGIHIKKQHTENKPSLSSRERHSPRNSNPTRENLQTEKPEVKPKPRVSTIPEISALADYARLKVIVPEDEETPVQEFPPNKKEGFFPLIQTRHSRRPMFTADPQDFTVKGKALPNKTEVSAKVSKEPKPLVFPITEKEHQRTGMFKLGDKERQEKLPSDDKANECVSDTQVKNTQYIQETNKPPKTHPRKHGVEEEVPSTDNQRSHQEDPRTRQSNNPQAPTSSSANNRTRTTSGSEKIKPSDNTRPQEKRKDISSIAESTPYLDKNCHPTQTLRQVYNTQEDSASSRKEEQIENAQAEKDSSEKLQQDRLATQHEDTKVKQQSKAKHSEEEHKLKKEEKNRADDVKIKNIIEESRASLAEEERRAAKREEERRAREREAIANKIKEKREKQRDAERKAEEERKRKQEEERRAAEKEQQRRAAQKEQERRAAQKEQQRRAAQEELQKTAARKAALEEQQRRAALEEQQRAVLEEQKRRAAQEEQQKRAALEEQKKKAAQVEQQKRAAQEEKQRKAAQEEQQRRAAQEEQQRRAAQEEQQRRAAQEEQQRRAAQEEQQRRAAQEEQQKRVAQEEQQKRAAQEEQQKRAAQEEQQRKAAQVEQQKIAALEEQKKKSAQEEQQRRAALEEQQRRAVYEEQERRAARAAHEEKQRIAAHEEQQRRTAQEEQERRAAQEEKQRIAAHEEQQRRAAQEEQQRRAAQEEQQRRAAQEEQERRAALEEQQRRAAYEEQQKRAAQQEQQRRAARAAHEVQQRRAAQEEQERRAVQEEEQWRAALIEEQRQAKQAEENVRTDTEERNKRKLREQEKAALILKEETMRKIQEQNKVEQHNEEQRRETLKKEEKDGVTKESQAALKEEKRVAREEIPAQRIDALQYYAITSTDSEKKPRERELRSPLPPQQRNNPVGQDSFEDQGTHARSYRPHAPASPAPSLPRSNASSPALGARPSMFRVKDNTFKGSSFTKSIKPRFHKNFGEDYRVGSPMERGSERGEEEQENMRRSSGTPVHPDIGSNRLSAIREFSSFQPASSSQDYSGPVPHHRPYSRRSIVLDEDDSRSVISNMSEGVESYATSATDLSDLRGLYYDDRPESACSFSSDASRSLGKPPAVPPKSEKALRRAKRLTSRRINKESCKAGTDSPAGVDKPLQDVSRVPSSSSSSTEVRSSNRNAMASPHFSSPVSLAHAPTLGSSLPSSHTEHQSSYSSVHASPHATGPISLQVASPHATAPVSLPVVSTHATGPASHTVAHVPSSPTPPHANHPAPVTQYHVESTYTQSYPLTQRKVLQDIGSGQYFVVDVPVQVKTKTFIDPATGKYVQLNVRESAQNTARSQPKPQPQQTYLQPQLQPQMQVKPHQQPLSQAPPAGKPVVLYDGYHGYPQGYQPAANKSVPHHRSSAPVAPHQDQQQVTESSSCGYPAPEISQNSEGPRYSPEKTPYMDTVNDSGKTYNTVYNTHGPYESFPECDTNSQLAGSSVCENENSAHSRYQPREIITISDLEDFMDMSDW